MRRLLGIHGAGAMVSRTKINPKFERRARRYLDPSIQPRPVPFEGDAPNMDNFTFRNMQCWGLRIGVVCSACYNHPKHYLGQSIVICPWNRTSCRRTKSADEDRQIGVDLNQCVLK